MKLSPDVQLLWMPARAETGRRVWYKNFANTVRKCNKSLGAKQEFGTCFLGTQSQTRVNKSETRVKQEFGMEIARTQSESATALDWRAPQNKSLVHVFLERSPKQE